MQSGFQYLHLHLLIIRVHKIIAHQNYKEIFFLGSGWEELFTRQGTPK